MTTVMLRLGEFKFSINTAAYNSLQRTWTFNWQSQKRIGINPALHYMGSGDNTISLSGTIYPGNYGKADYPKQIAKKAAEGKPLLLVSGLGDVMGYWVVKTISETDTVFFSDGQPRKITFSLNLSYYGENYGV